MSRSRQAHAEMLLLQLPAALRAAGLPSDPGRSAVFLRAVAACRPSTIDDLRRIGRLTLVGTRDDLAAYDEAFDAVFGEATFAGKVPEPEEDRAPRERPPQPDGAQPLDMTGGAASGRTAAADHLTGRKSFGSAGEAERRTLATLARRLDALPTVLRRRHVASARGSRIDLARTAREARRSFGETIRLMREQRPPKPRRLLILIDVSGSMKAHSETALRLAHLATRRLPKVETFCFGTRLTRVTGTLRHPSADSALAALSGLVFDFDGGTQIGPSLESFLAASRHAALVRGAITVIVSDGLERGDPAPMAAAIARLARLSRRLIWATPLAADPRYRPATRAMAAVLPSLDALCDGSSLAAMGRLLDALEGIDKAPRGRAGARFARERPAA
ncbi:MAG: VWA domain-containing protein [Mesorhizobium sp.]